MVAPIKLTKKGMVEKIAEPDDDGDQKSSRLEISRQVDKSSASLLNIGQKKNNSSSLKDKPLIKLQEFDDEDDLGIQDSPTRKPLGLYMDASSSPLRKLDEKNNSNENEEGNSPAEKGKNSNE